MGGELPGAALSCLGLAALGVGLMQAFGNLTDAALLLVGVALVLALLALKAGLRTPSRAWWVVTTVILGLTNLLYPHLGGPFAYHVDAQVALTLGLTAMAGTACVLRPGRAALAAVGAAALCLLWLMAITWNWGSDPIDVFNSVTGATAALLHGANPYSPIFSFRVPQYPWYIPGHFVYGPIVPVLTALGWLVGDVRVMSVVALAIASPFNVGMVNRSWVEIYIVAGVVMWLALRATHRSTAIVCLWVAMLVDPVNALVLLPAFIWSKRARLEMVVAAIGAALFVLPFALVTGVGQFIHDIVGFQLAMPPWHDSLTVTAFVWQTWHAALPSLLSVVVVLLAIPLLAWRGRPAHLGDVAVQAAVIFLSAFLVAKFAFFDEYYVVAAMLVTGLAGVGVAFPAGDVALPAVHELRGLIPRWGTFRPLD